MPSRIALGRGLDSLIPDLSSVKSDSGESGVLELELAKIKTNPFQPRTLFSEKEIQELAKTISEKGILSPVVVRKAGTSYELISGERRLRACKFLKLKKIPALIRNIVSDQEMLELGLIENLQRENLNIIDEAGAYQILGDRFHLTHEEIAEKVGKDRSSVTNALRIIKLNKTIQKSILNNTISFGHAKILAGIEDEKEQSRLFGLCLTKRLSVRQLEHLVSDQAARPKKAVMKAAGGPDVFTSYREKLQRFFGTKVQINQENKKKGRVAGKIAIDYYNAEDLDRILKLLNIV